MEKRILSLLFVFALLFCGCSGSNANPKRTIVAPDGRGLYEAYWKNEEYLICMFQSDDNEGQLLVGEYNIASGNLNIFYEGNGIGRAYPAGCVF